MTIHRSQSIFSSFVNWRVLWCDIQNLKDSKPNIGSEQTHSSLKFKAAPPSLSHLCVLNTIFPKHRLLQDDWKTATRRNDSLTKLVVFQSNRFLVPTYTNHDLVNYSIWTMVTWSTYPESNHFPREHCPPLRTTYLQNVFLLFFNDRCFEIQPNLILNNTKYKRLGFHYF